MNRQYRTIYDAQHNTCVAVSELSKCHGKCHAKSIVAASIVLCALCLSQVYAYDVNNTTDIHAGSGSAIDADFPYSSENINISNSGRLISDNRYGINALSDSGNITIDNSGEITSDAASINAFIIQGSLDVNVFNSAKLNSTNGYGISARGPGKITLDNRGEITSDWQSMEAEAEDDINVFNSAKLVANDGFGIVAASNSGKVTVENSGEITVGDTGVYGVSHGVGRDVNIGNSGMITSIYYGIAGAGKANVIIDNQGAINSGDSSIFVNEATTIIINNSGNLTSTQADGINVSAASVGSTITNSGDITVSAGRTAILGGPGADTLILAGGTITGTIDLSGGGDTVVISNGFDSAKMPLLDGTMAEGTLTVEGYLRGYTNDTLLSNKGTNLQNWHLIRVVNNGTLKPSGDLFTSDAKGIVTIDKTSTLDLKGNSPGVFTINGDVYNAGVMTMADGFADDVTTITGHYVGAEGSSYHIDIVLGDDSSATDKLVVNGNTSATTALVVTNAGGAGGQTTEGIKVVQVDGVSNGTFTMAAPVQAGSYEYRLFKNGVSTPSDGDWYLRSTLLDTYLYRPAVAAYSSAQSINQDASYALLTDKHRPIDSERAWGRIFTSSQFNNGHTRFEYDQKSSGLQVGYDLMRTSISRAGVTVQYSNSRADACDRIRPAAGLSADTGSMNSSAMGLGGYYGLILPKGGYVDFSGQLNRLSNRFTDMYVGKASQNAWQVGLSAQISQPVATIAGWQLSPQAQLAYLHSQYASFSDNLSRVDALNASSLRTLVGLRAQKDTASAQYYALVNVKHDFIKPQSVTLHDRTGSGSSSVSESFDQTGLEVGAGASGKIGAHTTISAEASYERSFAGRASGARLDVGLKTVF